KSCLGGRSGMGQGGGRPERGPHRRHRPGGGALPPPGARDRRGEKEAGVAMNLLIENRDKVRILTMNRPEKRNALDTALTQALLKELRTSDAEDAVDAIVLTGAGPGFCAGADLGEMKALTDPHAAEARAELTMQLHLVLSKMTTPV